MSKKPAVEFRRAGEVAPPAVTPWTRRWFGRLALLAVSVLLLSLAFAPIHQFYLAWVGLVPWLLVIHHCRSQKSAFLWGWIGGTMFFVANMWWMAYLTLPGMLGLMSILALYWGVAAVVIHGVGVLDGASTTSPARVIVNLLVLASCWTALEWVRGNFIWGGLPWLYLGHTQSAFLIFCQLADVTGVYGISFLVVMINGWFAMLVIDRFSLARLKLAGVTVLAMVLVSVVYGGFRFSQQTTRPGPVVMVVQANYPQDPSGQKGAPRDEIAQFHLKTTEQAAAAYGRPVDLVVWSETMMPELNRRGREMMRGEKYGKYEDYGRFCDEVFGAIQNLAMSLDAHVLAGGEYYDILRPTAAGEKPTLDRRNSAYYFERSGLPSEQRYDKIHLVPFGEFLPFKETLPSLNKLLLSLTPYAYDYTLTPGKPDALTVFNVADSLQTATRPASLAPRWKFVAPICFEDIFADGVATMFRPADGSDDKRADFLVNITNDGWYRGFENAQHLQAALFRSIENRVPTARSVNTGISGFVDSLGRTFNLVPVRTPGASIAQLSIDSRITFYTRFDDVFARLCFAVMIFKIGGSAVRWKKGRKAAS